MPVSDASTARFESAASDVLRSARGAFTDLLTEAGLGAARPATVAKALGVDNKLAWKVCRFVHDPDELTAFRHLPGAAGIELVLRAASEAGISTTHVSKVRRADLELREFVQRSAGDRHTFEVMVTSHAGIDARASLEQCRQLYRAHAAVWGVRARVQAMTLFIRPSDVDETKLDIVQVSGLVGLERLRPSVPWIVRVLRAGNDSGSESYRMIREPLDASGSESGGMPLLREFCSDPLPELHQFEDANGWIYDELAPSVPGRAGAVNCMTGEIHRRVVPRYREPENTQARYHMGVRTPVEASLFDVYIHKSLDHFGDMRMNVFGLLENRPAWGGNETLGEPVLESASARVLGSPPVVATPRLAHYGQLIDRSLALCGWGPASEFRGYRAEVEYPPAPCKVMLSCELAAR
ncbi:MAG: hypothetical protein RLN60_02415 [Phycisphaerales bacterium]